MINTHNNCANYISCKQTGVMVEMEREREDVREMNGELIGDMT